MAARRRSRATRRAAADLEAALPCLGPARVSVFIGGGTPSLFSPDAIAT